MINKRKTDTFVWSLTFLLYFSYVSCSSSTVPTSTGTVTSTTDLSTTTDPATTSDPATTPYTDAEDVTETSNNVLWLIIGVICAVVLVIGVVIAAAVAYAVHRSKRVHPHSDTESFYTERSESPSEAHTRPTTASHILLEPEEEAMSKPVTMTPFELRKLYIETFPYRNWRRGFDGSLRPKMTLKFVDPSIYSKSKGEERQFRDKIYNYEMSDSLTLRSSALSRMMHHARLPTMSEMDPLPEGQVPPTGHEVHNSQGHRQQQEQNQASHVDFERVCMRSEDVELM